MPDKSIKSIVDKLSDSAPFAVLYIGVLVFIIGAVESPVLALQVADSGWRVGFVAMGLILTFVGLLLQIRVRVHPFKEIDHLSFFKMSLSHPKVLSKRLTASFVVNIYLPEVRQEVEQKLRAEFDKQESSEHIYDTNLAVGNAVKVKLYSPVIDFSEPAAKKLQAKLNTIHFLGKPKDDCAPGVHQATLAISDEKTGHEYQSANFPVQIVDFAFDHVSRPLLSNLTSLVLGIGSFTIFVLTLLQKIDITLGLASGTTVGALASTLYVRFLWLYERPNVSEHR